MYLAKTILGGQPRYILRESFQKNGITHYRDLFDLGGDPSKFIVYPGGNAYYINGAIETRLDQLCVHLDEDELDDIFWPYVKPQIQRAVEYEKKTSTAAASVFECPEHRLPAPCPAPYPAMRDCSPYACQQNPLLCLTRSSQSGSSLMVDANRSF